MSDVLVTAVVPLQRGRVKVEIAGSQLRRYVIVDDPDIGRRILDAWRTHHGHLLIPSPDPSEVYYE